MSYVLFFVYLSLFAWLLTKIRFVTNTGLSAKIIIGLFVLKVFTGCAYAVIMMQSNGLSDTIFFHKEGLKEYNLLLNDPKQYVINFFHSGYQNGYDGLLSSQNSYWKDLQGNIIIRFLSVCNIFSFGNYYINVIFYNFVIFFGGIGLYRVYDRIYPNKKYLLVATCFLLPSLLIYTSTIHKEGLIFAAIGLAVYNMYATLNNNRFNWRQLIYILLAMSFIFLQRNYVLLAMLPAILAWVVVSKKKYSSFLTFSIIYFLGIFIFFTAHFLSPKLNLPQSIINKQVDFQQLSTASTYIQSDTLQPNFKSFIIIAPQAFDHGFLRPFFTDMKLSASLLPVAFEIFIYEIIFLLFIFFRDKKINADPFIYFGFFFGVSILLIIGYTIPIIGAIIRYRSIYLPFLLTPVLCTINWQKVKLLIT